MNSLVAVSTSVCYENYSSLLFRCIHVVGLTETEREVWMAEKGKLSIACSIWVFNQLSNPSHANLYLTVILSSLCTTLFLHKIHFLNLFNRTTLEQDLLVGLIFRIWNSKMPVDLLHPTAEQEAGTHKLKRLVQSPNSFFMDIKCPGCFQITTVFSHAQTVVLCGSCNVMLCQPTGGRARLTEGCSYRKKVD